MRSGVALAFSSICGKINVDSRKGLDEAGLFESYLRSQKANKINNMRGSQIGCHFYFHRMAVLMAVPQTSRAFEENGNGPRFTGTLRK